MNTPSHQVSVFSIFFSIQGESTYQGLPCIFVRLAGCPLRCSYCDTRVACDAAGVQMTSAEILDRIRHFPSKLVEVTGGEPLAQEGTLSLLKALCDEGYDVLLETSGAEPIVEIDSRVVVIMDIKTPGSGMSDRFLKANIEGLKPRQHQIKFVVTCRADFDFAVEMIEMYQLSDRLDVLVSPVAGLSPADVAAWILDSGRPMRLQLQLHRVIWPTGDDGQNTGQER